MSSSSLPLPGFESRNSILVEFRDTDMPPENGPRTVQDETIRRYFSLYLPTKLSTDGPHGDLDRSLALACEQEQFCRGARDLFGVARCLGNQALIQKARGRAEEALTVLDQLEPLCRRLDDVEGLVFALSCRASLLAGPLNQPVLAISVAEQAKRVAQESRLETMTREIQTVLEQARARLSGN